MALSVETKSALFDELRKIAEAELQPEKPKTPQWKRVLKAGALSAAGLTAGYSAGMLVEEGLRRTVGKKWPQLSPDVRYKILYPISGALGLGAVAAQQLAAAKYKRQVEGDE